MHNFVNKTQSGETSNLFSFKNSKYLVLAIAMSLAFGYYTGSKNIIPKIFAQNITTDMVLENKYNASGTSNFFDKKIEINNSDLFNEVKNSLDSKFVSWKATYTPPTAKDFENSIISGYVSAYKDPYTQYFPPTEAKIFKDQVKGSFGGVGMEVGNKDGFITVIAPLKDTPSMRAGIKSGDIILKVDDKDISGMSTEQAVGLIRGEIGTEVRVTIISKTSKTPKEIKIKREEIKIPTIDTKLISGVFIISLYSFTAESPELFKNALIRFVESKSNKLVIDLRGNPGGYLDAAVEIASFFLPQGKVIVSEKGSDPSKDVELRSKGYNVLGDNLKLYIIVDEGSASASEILAGALQDQKVAKVYGQKSYGKGSVQELIDLKNGGSLKVTIAKWFTPNGRSITEEKIVPDFVVTRSATTTLDIETKTIVNMILKEKK